MHAPAGPELDMGGIGVRIGPCDIQISSNRSFAVGRRLKVAAANILATDLGQVCGGFGPGPT